MLRIDSNIIWTIVNLLILYACMMRFLFKPVRNILAKRKEEIDASFADVKKQKEQAQEYKDQAEKELQAIQANHDKEMADARIKASHEYEKILAEANAKSDEILEEARQKTAAVAREEKARAKSEIADEIEGENYGTDFTCNTSLCNPTKRSTIGKNESFLSRTLPL